MTASRVLTFQLAQMQAAWPPLDTASIRSEIATLLYALTKLGARFPLLGQPASLPRPRLSAL